MQTFGVVVLFALACYARGMAVVDPAALPADPALGPADPAFTDPAQTSAPIPYERRRRRRRRMRPTFDPFSTALKYAVYDNLDPFDINGDYLAAAYLTRSLGQPDPHYDPLGPGLALYHLLDKPTPGGAPAGAGAAGVVDAGPGAVDPMGPGAIDPMGPGAIDPMGPGAIDPMGPGAIDPMGPGAIDPMAAALI